MSTVTDLLHEPRKETAVRQLVRELREMIAHEGLGTGDSLPTERETSERFGVARNTVREAFGVLRAYGVVDVRPKIGAVLINRHVEAALDVFSFQLSITAETFSDVQGFRNLVEVGLYDAIAGRIDAADFADLENSNARMLAARSVAEAAAADHAFHLRLVGIAGNKTVHDVYRIMEPVILKLMETGKATRGRDVASQSHLNILTALRHKDRLSYHYHMTDHLRQGLSFIGKETADSVPTTD